MCVLVVSHIYEHIRIPSVQALSRVGSPGVCTLLSEQGLYAVHSVLTSSAALNVPSAQDTHFAASMRQALDLNSHLCLAVVGKLAEGARQRRANFYLILFSLV